ncbi:MULTISPECIES: hypothetical protein [Mesorhizobium]|nr:MULTISPECIES: hypothetical protein [Mesorhizobium]
MCEIIAAAQLGDLAAREYGHRVENIFGSRPTLPALGSDGGSDRV